MKVRSGYVSTAIAGAALLVLAGCGGGSSVTRSDTVGVAPSSTVLSGVAATGTGFEGAIVTVIDSRGVVVGASAPVAADGSYGVALAPGAAAPFVLTASRADAAGAVESLVSVVAAASDMAGVNLTPVTSLVASRLSPSGDPMRLASEVAAGTATINSAILAAKVLEARQLLGPVIKLSGNADFDPIGTPFTADGTGHDRLLDAITVSFSPSGPTATNVSIGIRPTSRDAGAQPTSINFASHRTLAEIKQDAANRTALTTPVDTSTLVPAGTSVLIDDFLRRWTACLALPLPYRVTTEAQGASGVVAPACRTLFSGNDPATYRHDGSMVGKGKAMGALFTASSTGTVFSQGAYEYTRGNGDIVIGYRSLDAAGAQAFDLAVLRNEGGQLKLVGNRNAFQGSVTARYRVRHSPTADSSNSDIHATGYVLHVPNVVENGRSVFDRVEVTTPFGTALVLKPNSGDELLSLVQRDPSARGAFLCLRAAWEAGVAATAASAGLTDDAIAAIPAQSAWTFTYYLVNEPSRPAAVQYYRTRARALTIAELQTRLRNGDDFERPHVDDR